MRYGILAAFILFALIGFWTRFSKPEDLSGALYKDASKSVDERVTDLLNRMTTINS